MHQSTDYPQALKAPADSLVEINSSLIVPTFAASRQSPRQRIIQPLHQTPDDRLQRMLNTLQPGSYIRPHQHAPDRGESLIVLSGTLLYLTFDEDGAVRERLELKAGTERVGVDIQGGLYHSFAALEPDTVLFEVKPGPYDPETDKTFASWAPEENSPDAPAYLDLLLKG